MGAKSLAQKGVEALQEAVDSALIEEGKVATGKTRRSLRVLASGNDATGSASLIAGAQWKYVGNGRGPGKAPPLGSLEEWIQARGRNLNAYALQDKIQREGTRDFRLGRKNIFLKEIDAWQRDVIAEVVNAPFVAEQSQNMARIIKEVNIT